MKNHSTRGFMEIVFVTIVLAATGCSDLQSDTVVPDQGKQAEPDKASIVSLTTDQLELAKISTTPAAIGEIRTRLTFTGKVALNQHRVAHITSRVSGVVREVPAILGSVLRTGDVMAVIESGELGEAKAQLLAARQQLEMAATDLTRTQTVHDNTVAMLAFLSSSPALDRLGEMENLDLGENRSRLLSAYSSLVFTRMNYLREKNLYERQISGQRDYQAAESAFKKAESDYAATRDEIRFANRRSLLEMSRAKDLSALSLRAVERQLGLLGLGAPAIEALSQGKEAEDALARYTILSPFDATVIERRITLGEQVQPSADLFTISDLSTVWVIASVYEPELPAVLKGQSATFSVRSHLNRRFEGEVTWISDVLDEETRSIQIRLQVDNGERLLKPGMFAEVDLTGIVGTGLVVPASAVFAVAEQAYVFKSLGGGSFEPVAVDIGAESDGVIPILKGVSAGTEVVSGGVAELKSHWQYQGGV
jgi:cobalt-zinc-cadmium efflux system membrane fusion protein